MCKGRIHLLLSLQKARENNGLGTEYVRIENLQNSNLDFGMPAF